MGGAAEAQGDVPNFTTITSVIQVSNIVEA